MITQTELLAGLQKKLSKEDFNVIMDIYLTPLEDIKKEYDTHIKKLDIKNAVEIGSQLETFNKIKCKYIFNKNNTDLCSQIIKQLDTKQGEINARNTITNDRGNMRRYVVGGPKTTGETGN